MGPPADSEYAVDPVGVDSSKPSAYYSVLVTTWAESTYHSFRQMLIVEIRVYNGEVRIAAAMQSDLIHDLPACISNLIVSSPRDVYVGLHTRLGAG